MNFDDSASLIEELDRRLAEIHGLDCSINGKPREKTKEAKMDVRHDEFQAMADVFLGENYDRTKLEAVEGLQIALRQQQETLLERYKGGQMAPEQYVDEFNKGLLETFASIERVLGARDFLRLFGAPIDQLGGYIDKETFLREETQRSDALRP